jgi:3'-phosphoadenosine 5'-phosphosulfate (PAPS) 3'-phosphatase
MSTDLEIRKDTVVQAASLVGEWLMSVRRQGFSSREAAHGQLKTDVDKRAEDMFLEVLVSAFPGEPVLSEEMFEEKNAAWSPPGAFWTVDALDGTRSYVEGYDGFCVQAAFIEGGEVRLGVIHEPVARTTYWALAGGNAYADGPKGRTLLTAREPAPGWPARPVFVDSTVPAGAVGKMVARHNMIMLEIGSIGLKMCRVAQGMADVYAKRLTFKLWDSAPGEPILRAAGAKLGLWSGTPVRYDTSQVYWDNILAASDSLFTLAAEELRGE